MEYVSVSRVDSDEDLYVDQVQFFTTDMIDAAAWGESLS